MIHPIKQRGSALIMGMVLLIVLTLLASVASNSSVMQEQMTGNFRDMTLAFEASENAARWGEAWLTSFTTLNASNIPCESACSMGQPIWLYGNHPDDVAYRDDNWWNNFGHTYGYDPGTNADTSMRIPNVDEQPRYLMEQTFFKQENLTELPPTAIVYYRVTSRGQGARPNSVSVVETTVVRRITP